MLVPLARRARSVVRRLVPLGLRSEIHYRLVANRLTRRIYDNLTELDIIEIELHDGSGKTWSTFKTDAPTGAMSERVVEIPWVLSRYAGQRRVLDIGPAYALPLYLRHLRKLRIPQLHGVDLTDKPVKGLMMDRADVRQMPYADASFDLIFCISTLEHIGCDNARYDIEALADPDGDARALAEMRRVLADDGRILITVPFGRRQDYGWFRQYDRKRWDELLGRVGLLAAEQACYGYSSTGWMMADDPSVLERRGYQEMGAPAATAVLCASLKKRGSLT
jgi:SAM-dependent methyltransferase